MKIQFGDIVILNNKHVMKGATVTILKDLPAPGGTAWEAIVVGGTWKTWVTLEQIERKV